jgi:hypothetical protein
MHNYNVGNRYNTETRVGNWYEEKELKQYEFKEYLYQKEHSNNLTLNTTAKLGFSNQGVSLSKDDGQLRLGDSFQLLNPYTQGILAYNVNEPILGEETYAVTTTPQTQPALRNVLTIESAVEGGSEVVRYGDKVRLTATVNGRKVPLSPLSSTSKVCP